VNKIPEYLEDCLDGLTPLQQMESVRTLRHTLNISVPTHDGIAEWIDLRDEIRRRYKKMECLFIIMDT